MNGAVICIRVFDLKGKKATPTASGGAVPKLAAAKHAIYFQCRSQNGKKNREKMAEGKSSKLIRKLLKQSYKFELISYRPTFHPTSSLQKAECKQ